MSGQHSVRASAGDNTGQNTDKGHTTNPRREIKFLTPPRIESGPPGLKARTLPTTEINRSTEIKFSVRSLLQSVEYILGK